MIGLVLYYRELSSFGPVMFLSAPSGASGCLSGKYQWLQDHFGANSLSISSPDIKTDYRYEKAILIDDMPFNVSAFKARGGKAVLFPRVWNKLHTIYEPTEYVLASIKRVINE